MWLAAGARAFHYNWDATRDSWLDDRDSQLDDNVGHELFTRLAESISEQLGHPVKI
jgi:Frataxin-like domain